MFRYFATNRRIRPIQFINLSRFASTQADELNPTRAIKALHDIQLVMGNKLKNVVKYSKICVIGGQSAGKSSVLDAIIGMDILPKGSGMVTKHPLELSLMRSEPGTPIYAQFDQINEKIYNMEEVKRRLIELNQGELSHEPIILSLFSPLFYNIKLVDLPGMIQVAGKSQNKNLPVEIKKMCRPYIEDDKNIKLVVASATEDLATAVGIREIQKANQEANALYVITKTDMIASKADLIKILRDNEYTTGLGVYGVRLRSVQEFEAGKSLQEVVEIENKFFQSVGISDLRDVKYGIPSLRQTLAKEQLARISSDIPQIVQAVDSYLEQTEQDKSLLTQLSTNTDLDRIAKDMERLITELHPNSASRTYFEYNLYTNLHHLVTERMNRAIQATHGDDLDTKYQNEITYAGLNPTNQSTSNTSNTNSDSISSVNGSGDKLGVIDDARSMLIKIKTKITDLFTNENFHHFLIFGKGTPTKVSDVELRGMAHEFNKLVFQSPFYKFVITNEYDIKRHKYMEDTANVIHLVTNGHEVNQSYNISETSRQLCIDQILTFVNKTADDFAQKRGESADLTKRYFKYLLDNLAVREDKMSLGTHARTMIYSEKRSTSSYYDMFMQLRNLYKEENQIKRSWFQTEKYPILIPVFGSGWQRAEYNLKIKRMSNKLFTIYATELIDPLIYELLKNSFKFFNEKNIENDANQKNDEIAKLLEFQKILRSINTMYCQDQPIKPDQKPTTSDQKSPTSDQKPTQEKNKSDMKRKNNREFVIMVDNSNKI